MKTLIELFTEDMLENVISALVFRPEKVIFAGFCIPLHRRMSIESFLKRNGVNAECEYLILNTHSMEEIIPRFERIIGENKDCAIELGGGDELLAAAMGAVATRTETPIFRYDIANDEAIKVYRCDEEEVYPMPEISVEDNVRLYGGCVDKTKTFRHWDITPEFEKDILGMWKIYSRDTAAWNRQMAMFAVLDELDSDSRQEWVYVEQSRLKNRKLEIDRKIISQLSNAGYISGFKADRNKIMYRYKNSQVRAVMMKTGNLLELYTYIAANGIEMAGRKYFNDLQIGVFIDWDGVIHQSGDSVKDTTNEVDVAAMHGVIPVFISCKGGDAKKEALYELQTIADKFGGSYAKKVLVMTEIRGEDSRAHLKQRAKDMGIVLIENLHNKSLERFRKELLTV